MENKLFDYIVAKGKYCQKNFVIMEEVLKCWLVSIFNRKNKKSVILQDSHFF